MIKFIRDRIDVILHYNMLIVGGFFGVYALLQRDGFFGSSQTANMIYMITDLISGNLWELVFRIFALAIYASTLVFAFLLPRLIKTDMRYICIVTEIIGVIFTGFLPQNINPLVALYPIFAMTGLQWGTFSGAKGYNSATIFSTNNLRQTVFSLAEYLRTKKTEELEKFKFYAITLTFYHIGVVIGCIALAKWNTSGIWLCIVPLVTAFSFLTVSGLKPSHKAKHKTHRIHHTHGKHIANT